MRASRVDVWNTVALVFAEWQHPEKRKTAERKQMESKTFRFLLIVLHVSARACPEEALAGIVFFLTMPETPCTIPSLLRSFREFLEYLPGL
jgi:hypothetical protein